jgi:hypothetical protein
MSIHAVLASISASRYEVLADGPRARSSAEEHLLDMEGVTGSIPVAPTINPSKSADSRAGMSIDAVPVALSVTRY